MTNFLKLCVLKYYKKVYKNVISNVIQYVVNSGVRILFVLVYLRSYYTYYTYIIIIHL